MTVIEDSIADTSVLTKQDHRVSVDLSHCFLSKSVIEARLVGVRYNQSAAHQHQWLLWGLQPVELSDIVGS